MRRRDPILIEDLDLTPERPRRLSLMDRFGYRVVATVVIGAVLAWAWWTVVGP